MYITFADINDLQQEIMREVDQWVKLHKTPIAKKEILTKMRQKGKKEDNVIYALSALIKKGYIRKAYMASPSNLHYVQLRSIKI